MEVIATTNTPKAKYRYSKREWISIIVLGIINAAICTYLYTIGGSSVAFFLLILYVGLLGKIFIGKHNNKKLPFVAFLNKGTLNFDYVKQDNNGFKHNIKLSFGLTVIDGYTLHSFFGGRPAFLDLHIIDADRIVHQTILIEELSDAEYHKLIAFIEKIIPNKRKAINENRDTQQKFISP